jgi:DNA repair exonuclease SbcCD ATPase subunit
MKIKHKVIREYQYLSPDKKIFVLKSGTILEEYVYKVKNESIPLDKDIIDNNPDFFETIDWKFELLDYMKVQKMPQPAQLGKKLIPFIEEMILSSINTNVKVVDEESLNEIERKESELNRKEKRIKDKEEEIEIRLKRVEKRELEHKEDLKQLDKKEDELRNTHKTLTERELDIQDKLQDINEKERNIDRGILESAKDLDGKYEELRVKIDKDLRIVSEREKDLEVFSKELKEKESKLNQIESDIDDKIRDFYIRVEEYKSWEIELRKLDGEIKDWESLNWKFRRNCKPPSVLVD